MFAKFKLNHDFDDTAKNNEPQEREPSFSSHQGGCDQFAGTHDRSRENKAGPQVSKAGRKCLRRCEDAA